MVVNSEEDLPSQISILVILIKLLFYYIGILHYIGILYYIGIQILFIQISILVSDTLRVGSPSGSQGDFHQPLRSGA